MSTLATLDSTKKWMTCLGCGRTMWTDRCHRICKKCRRRIEATPSRSAHSIMLPRGLDVYAVGAAERVEW